LRRSTTGEGKNSLNRAAIPEVKQSGQAQCYPGKTFGHRAQHIAEIMRAQIDPLNATNRLNAIDITVASIRLS